LYNLLTEKDIVIEYEKWGHGPKILIAFPGFTQSIDDLVALRKHFNAEKYTIYTFNHFFHGKSNISHKTILEGWSKHKFKQFFEFVFQQLNIDNFETLGFSLGGRFSLLFIELFPKKVTYVYLLAPDGLKENFWQLLATRSLVGRFFLKKINKNPKSFLWTIQIANRIKILPNSYLRFAEFHMKDPTLREMLYNSWLGFRYLSPSVSSIGKIIDDNKIEWMLFLGAKDYVIPPRRAKRFIRIIEKPGLIKILNTGHKNILTKTIEFLNDRT